MNLSYMNVKDKFRELFNEAVDCFEYYGDM